MLNMTPYRTLITVPEKDIFNLRRFADFIGRTNFMGVISSAIVAILAGLGGLSHAASESLNRGLCAC